MRWRWHDQGEQLYELKRIDGTYGERSVVESIVGVVLEEIRVALVGHRRVDVIRYALPVLDQLGIVTPHRWLRRRVEAPEFRPLVEVDLAVPGPHGGGVDVIGDAGETVADLLRVVAVHGRVDVPPVSRALRRKL